MVTHDDKNATAQALDDLDTSNKFAILLFIMSWVLIMYIVIYIS